MRISDWSSDVCSSDLGTRRRRHLDRLADLRGRVGGKADLDLGIARYRARDARQRGLEIVEGRRCGHFESALTSFEAGRKRMRTRLLQSSPSNETRGSFDLIRGPLLRWRNGPRIKSGVTKEGVDEVIAKQIGRAHV